MNGAVGVGVDGRGDDDGPTEAVAGACKALQENFAITQVLLVGQPAAIKSALCAHAETDRLRIVPAAAVAAAVPSRKVLRFILASPFP